MERSRRASAMRASTCRARREISSACLTRPSLSARRSSSARAFRRDRRQLGRPAVGRRRAQGRREAAAPSRRRPAAATAATAASRSIFSICERNASMTAWLNLRLVELGGDEVEQQGSSGRIGSRRRAPCPGSGRVAHTANIMNTMPESSAAVWLAFRCMAARVLGVANTITLRLGARKFRSHPKTAAEPLRFGVRTRAIGIPRNRCVKPCFEAWREFPVRGRACCRACAALPTMAIVPPIGRTPCP